MPVETTSPNSEWTFGTLLVHLLAIIEGNDRRYRELREDDDERNGQRFTASQLAVAAALNAAKEAVAKAEMASEKRFDSVNEFRATLSDQQRTLLPRAEAELQFREVRQQFSTIQEQIAALFKINAERGGQKAGARELWGWIAGAVGILIAILTFTMRVTG